MPDPLTSGRGNVFMKSLHNLITEPGEKDSEIFGELIPNDGDVIGVCV